MNLIVSAAIVLLNPYVTVYISYKIPPFALSVHIPECFQRSIYVEVDSKVLLGLPFVIRHLGDYIIQVLPWVYIVCLTGSQ